jgi:hypothetical protein
VINFDVQWYQLMLHVIEKVFKQLKGSRNHQGQQTNFTDLEEVKQAHAAVDKVTH